VLNLVATAAIVTLVPMAYQWVGGLAFGLGVILIASAVYAWRMRGTGQARARETSAGVTIPASVRLVRWDDAAVPAPPAPSKAPTGSATP
jgi:hypothetical protein